MSYFCCAFFFKVAVILIKEKIVNLRNFYIQFISLALFKICSYLSFVAKMFLFIDLSDYTKGWNMSKYSFEFGNTFLLLHNGNMFSFIYCIIVVISNL